MIQIRKIFPYDPTFGGKLSKYDGYELITSNKVDPGISDTVEIKIDIKHVPQLYTSTLKRGIETGKVIAKKYNIHSVENIKELNEIPFELSTLLSKSEYEKNGSNLVRKRFIESFIEDKLLESRSDIKKRMDSLKLLFGNLPSGNGLFISHSFYMKIFQIYCDDPKLFEYPEVLTEKFDYTKKTFEFGQGFDLIWRSE